jgi:hypothetical protein
VVFVLRPLTQADAEAVAEWTYPGEYAFYDSAADADDLAELGVAPPQLAGLRGVSVYMTNNMTETRLLPDGQWVRSEPKAGTVNWSDASLHVLRNVGKSEIHTIRVELK